MIVFDLACADAHVFEGWFGSTDDYDGQRRRGLVTCPMCGSGDVDKAVMAPRVGAKGNQRGGVPAPSAKAMLAALAKAQADALRTSDFVGPRFAAEARAIHAGDAPQRSIHGQATIGEARALVDDGIPVAPLPLPVRAPGTDN